MEGKEMSLFVNLGSRLGMPEEPVKKAARETTSKNKEERQKAGEVRKRKG